MKDQVNINIAVGNTHTQEFSSDFGHSHCVRRLTFTCVQHKSTAEPDLSQHVSFTNPDGASEWTTTAGERTV